VIVPNVPFEATYRYERQDEPKYVHDVMPVVAFNDDGMPLVEEHNALRVASNIPGFQYIDRSKGNVVGTLPAAGWRVQWKADNSDEPIIGFVVYTDATTHPLVYDGDGYIEELDSSSGRDWTLIPPASSKPEATDE